MFNKHLPLLHGNVSILPEVRFFLPADAGNAVFRSVLFREKSFRKVRRLFGSSNKKIKFLELCPERKRRAFQIVPHQTRPPHKILCNGLSAYALCKIFLCAAGGIVDAVPQLVQRIKLFAGAQVGVELHHRVGAVQVAGKARDKGCLLYTSPSPRDEQ